MAIYHFESKIISRGAGRSAIAAAAYQSGEKLYNDYDGLTHDYTKKGGVLYTEILLPPQAPTAWKDRQTLWAAVESAEKTKDSRLARQLIVALPIELGRNDWLLLLRGFIQTECVDKGMCADFAIHDPDGHNPHAHIMVTMRPLDAHGKWQSKTQKEYLCRKADEERGFTAQEFLQAKEDGWEKQYKYRSAAGVSAWLTPTQAAREPGWERCSKQPKAAKFGRQNPLCARWNSPEQLLDWREAWADAVNRALEEKQQSARVTHLSHAALGLDEQPTVHEGSQARSLELQGIKADLCELNRQIRADNKLLRELKAQLAKLSKVVENTVEHIAETLERLRSSLIMLQYRLLVNRKRADTWKRQVNYYRPILQDYHAVKQQLTDKKSDQEQLQTNRSVLSPLQIVRRRQLAEQIATLTEEIEELRSRQAMILRNLDCKNNGEAQRFGSYLDKLEEMQEKLAAQRESLAQQLSATTKQYLEIENMIQPKDADAVHRHRTAMRKASTAEIYRQIQTTATVDDILFSKAEQRAEQITADTRNDAVFTRKPTEPTR
ncbi:MAG: MobQ family relaxase [Gemmiger sp.]|uniref:MobQ family relaxase n=1 Tax=Gemmiger sp. TaxID=2049027 RepID=UPI002A91FA5D|nr:MobQ family relaxase [Gemmiger sp.]MDY5204332.1 MobQ family relaxase [Gemmiger sp.]